MLIIKVDTGNSAFDGDGLQDETARILRDIADKIETEGAVQYTYRTIFDLNGNDVGRWKLLKEQP